MTQLKQFLEGKLYLSMLIVETNKGNNQIFHLRSYKKRAIKYKMGRRKEILIF